MDDLADAVERQSARFSYPRLFAELFQQHTFVAFNVGGVRVHSNIRGEDDSLDDLLADEILTNSLHGAGFLPFGRPATGSYDRVCFDMRGLKKPLDAPVVLMDHEAILCFSRIPRPRLLADGLMRLFELDTEMAEPGGRENAG